MGTGVALIEGANVGVGVAIVCFCYGLPRRRRRVWFAPPGVAESRRSVLVTLGPKVVCAKGQPRAPCALRRDDERDSDEDL